jgi:hypothetical protein
MWSKEDKKAFWIGVLASISAVILWDITKHEMQILNFKKKDNG